MTVRDVSPVAQSWPKRPETDTRSQAALADGLAQRRDAGGRRSLTVSTRGSPPGGTSTLMIGEAEPTR